MTVHADILACWRSASITDAEPDLSVLTPFKGDDPAPLLLALGEELGGGPDPNSVEIILYDDGTGDYALLQRLAALVEDAPCPVALLSDQVNRGRSVARNRLFAEARGRHVLFLDADMLPDSPHFLARWVSLIETEDPGVAFGGFSVDRAPRSRETALHRAFSASSECPPAMVRDEQPAKFVYTSNLMVRRDILEAAPFDDGFAGWGWEDVEWAARVAQLTPIRHVDNTATHLGLESPDKLLSKFQKSAPNFRRFVERHPDLAQALPSFKVARALSRAPAARALRPLFAALARDRYGMTPMTARVLALKLWRASWYGEALT